MCAVPRREAVPLSIHTFHLHKILEFTVNLWEYRGKCVYPNHIFSAVASIWP